MTELEKARQIINDVDKKMAELFVLRMNAAKTVAEYKKEHGLQVFDAVREAEVIKKNSMHIEDETLKSYYVEFIKSNMEISKSGLPERCWRIDKFRLVCKDDTFGNRITQGRYL